MNRLSVRSQLFPSHAALSTPQTPSLSLRGLFCATPSAICARIWYADREMTSLL
jgi:hypothetical protein